MVVQVVSGMISEFDRFCSDAADIGIAPEFHARLRSIDDAARSLDAAALVEARKKMVETACLHFREGEMVRHILDKPYGYAGDFEVIDWIYAKRVAASTDRGRFWDEFFHVQDAPLAVNWRRHRFFDELCLVVEDREARQKPIRILSVGSGPCREIVDGLKALALDPDGVAITCVDIDPTSVAYAKRLIQAELPRFDRSFMFHIGNAMRFRSQVKFDLIWSAGLFDYFNQKQGAFLLRRLASFAREGSRLVIGNFASSHATRAWIEWCGQWFLTHRSFKDLDDFIDDDLRECVEVSFFTDPRAAINFMALDFQRDLDNGQGGSTRLVQ